MSCHWHLDCYYPHFNKVERGIYWFHVVCPSICLWTKSCAHYNFHNTSQIHFIFTHLIKELQTVCLKLVWVNKKSNISIFLRWPMDPLHKRRIMQKCISAYARHSFVPQWYILHNLYEFISTQNKYLNKVFFFFFFFGGVGVQFAF